MCHAHTTGHGGKRTSIVCGRSIHILLHISGMVPLLTNKNVNGSSILC